MADYIYLLEHRLSGPQRAALRSVREIAVAKGLTLFLVGGAVRDLTSGSPVRDLDVVVQGSASRLRKDLEKAGAEITGEHESAQTLFARFPGGVRVEIGSTLSVTYPKPGKPVYKLGSIQDDLRRRDFTANAMALSLNEGSYGLLMDPLNGVADIENRQFRLVSNYGFIEDPVRMIRAARLMARLGWNLDERTQGRYETGQQEGYIATLSDFHRGYETEEIVHEEDPVRVLKRLEAEGWMKHLAPQWTSAQVNTADLDRLREAQMQLQLQGVSTNGGAASFPLLTARLSAEESATLKASFPRQGFVDEINGLEAEAKEFATQLAGKSAASASAAWKLIMSARPEAVLQTAWSSKSPAIQARFKSFYTEWPQARLKIPYALLTEMRITPELPGYEALLETLFFELMDGRLATLEEMKAFLEPYSPPAPPPPINLRRPRAAKKEAKTAKGRGKKGKAEPGEDSADEDTASETLPPEIDLSAALDDDEDEEDDLPPGDADMPDLDLADESEGDDDLTADEDDEPSSEPEEMEAAPAPNKPAKSAVPAKRPNPAPAKSSSDLKAATGKTAAPNKRSAPPAKAAPVKVAPAKTSSKTAAKTAAKAAPPAKPIPAKTVAARAVPPAKAAPVKTATAKPAGKSAPAKQTPAATSPADRSTTPVAAKKTAAKGIPPAKAALKSKASKPSA